MLSSSFLSLKSYFWLTKVLKVMQTSRTTTAHAWPYRVVCRSGKTHAKMPAKISHYLVDKHASRAGGWRVLCGE